MISPWGRTQWGLHNAARWLCPCPPQWWSGAVETQSASWSDAVSPHLPHTPVFGSTQTCSVAQLKVKAQTHEFMLLVNIPHTSVSEFKPWHRHVLLNKIQMTTFNRHAYIIRNLFVYCGVCEWLWVWVCVTMCVCVCVHACVHACVCACVCVWVCVCVKV